MNDAARPLSVIVVSYNMRRETPRTLYALTAAYQLGVTPTDYDVEVIDNGSELPLTSEEVTAYGANFRYVFVSPDHPSPCRTINEAVARATGDFVMVLIDGARIPSPGLLSGALACLRECPNAFIYTLSMHLGPRLQRESMLDGYDQATEDRLLESVPWRSNGYRLFDISVAAASHGQGYTGRIFESNAFCIDRKMFLELGGFDERFQSPGGGLANLEFFNRVHRRAGIVPVLLLGEATFHQFHGGVATNFPAHDDSCWRRMHDEYRALIGEPFRSDWRQPLYYGRPRPAAARLFAALPVADVPQPGLFVLGMHRSGTSCLAGMLQLSGFASGVVEQWNTDNRQGNRENPEVVRLNEALLRANAGGWEKPPKTRSLTIDDTQRATRDAILNSVAREGRPWLLKDPRLLLVLPFWREAVPNPRRIGIFRDPIAVAVSLYVRSRKPLGEGLALWLRYNRELLTEYDRSPFPILCFDLPAAAFEAQLDRALNEECGDWLADGRLDSAAIAAFYRDDLIHHRNVSDVDSLGHDELDASLLDEIRDVHERLLAVSGVPAYDVAPERPDGTATQGLSRLYEADQAAASGDMDGAVRLYRDAALGAADRTAVWLRLIDFLKAAGDNERALEAAREAVSNCPDEPSLLLAQSAVAKELGALDEALACAEQAVRFAPEAPLGWLRFGEILCDTACWTRAEEALRKAIALQAPGHFWAHARLGQALIHTGQRAAGDQAFGRAIELVPSSGKAVIWHRWAQALMGAGDLDAALERQREAARLAGEQPHIQATLTNLLKRLGQDG
ncbi:MAG: tetratricopeptide repeat protein [Methylotetracoccus sp.]